MLPNIKGRIWNPPLQILFLSVGVGALDNPKYCRGDQWSSVVYKNIIAFWADVQCTPLPVCARLIFLIVGAIQESPSNQTKKGDSWIAPTGLVVVLELMPVGEHSICSRREKGGYGIRPYGFNCCSDILPIGYYPPVESAYTNEKGYPFCKG